MVDNRRRFLGLAGALGIGAGGYGAFQAGTAAAEPEPRAVAGAATEQQTGTVTPQMFGAVADGVADDTQPIRDALASLLESGGPYVLYFPPGTYRITETIVTDTGLGRLTMTGVTGTGKKASVIHVDFTQAPGFDINSTLTYVTNLCFVGNRDLDGDTNTTALRFIKTVNTDDMDGKVSGCDFLDFDTAVRYVGRGLLFRGNGVAKCTVGLDISWPEDGVEKGGPVHVPPYGMRKWIITDNHFHTVFLAIRTVGPADGHFRGAVIGNNLLDIGRDLFYGDVINSTFVGNVVENAKDAPITITSGGHALTFADNILGGFPIDNEVDPEGETRRPPSAIVFETEASYVSISGNSFDWTGRSPVYFKAGARDVTLTANTFRNWHATPEADANDAAVRVEGDASQFSVLGNVFSDPVDGGSLVRIAGRLTASSVVGNVWNLAHDLLRADGTDDVYVESSPGRFNQLAMAVSMNGNIRVVSTQTSAPEPDVDSYGGFVVESAGAAGSGPGVKGGLRVTPTTANGSARTDLLCATTNTNGGVSMTFGPAGMLPPDGVERDIGSAQQRLRTVYAGQVDTTAVQLRAQSIGALPAAAGADGALIRVHDARSGLSYLAISDGKQWRELPLGPALTP